MCSDALTTDLANLTQDNLAQSISTQEYNSTHYALVSLIERWRLSPDQQGFTGALLIDLSKTFDTINHELLIAKLHAYVFFIKALEILFKLPTRKVRKVKPIQLLGNEKLKGKKGRNREPANQSTFSFTIVVGISLSCVA